VDKNIIVDFQSIQVISERAQQELSCLRSVVLDWYICHERTVKWFTFRLNYFKYSETLTLMSE
jgi:hypothetical protein